MADMDRETFLLTTLAEQCGDVSKAALKAARFGSGNFHPERGVGNATELRMEFVKLLAVADMIREEGIELFNFASNSDMRAMREHVDKVDDWAQRYTE